MSVRNRALSLFDSVLDRAVVPGYTDVGYRLRQRVWADNDPSPDALRGKTALVTGANSGIGTAIAARLARLGATVLINGRDDARGQQTRAEIAAAEPQADLRVEVCDVADLTAVAAFAAGLTSRLGRLDIVIHNAGVLPAERIETADGHEMTLATHVLGPVLLTERLAPLLAKSDDPRVIFMSSGGMYTQSLPVDDPEYRTGRYRGATAYARTKTDAGLLHADPGAALGQAQHLGLLHASRLGRYPRGRRITSNLPHADRPLAALTRARSRYGGLACRDHPRTADRSVLARPTDPSPALLAAHPEQ
jgi:hypothetical protein